MKGTAIVLGPPKSQSISLNAIIYYSDTIDKSDIELFNITYIYKPSLLHR